MTEQELLDQLQTDGVCEGRNYPVEVPSNALMPYSSYSVLSGVQSRELDGDCGEKKRYMFTCWCNNYLEAKNLVLQFKNSLRPYGSSAGDPMIDKDPDDESIWRIVNLDFYIIE